MIAVTGGEINTVRKRSTEILDLDYLTWHLGPDLPMAISDAVSVTSSDSKHFYVIGGYEGMGYSRYSSTIHALQCFAKHCEWKKMKQKLRKPKCCGVSMLIPYDKTKCIKVPGPKQPTECRNTEM